ncbi:hypothetical protein EJB05_00507, partial [Eragrostis curvula]
MASRFLLLVVVIFTLLCRTAVGQSDSLLRPLLSNCSTTGNYTDGSLYQRNLADLLARMPAAAGDNGWFYTGVAGKGRHKVFGLIMCYADSNAMQCAYCLASAPAGITKICPGNRDVSASYNACLLRYSDKPFFSMADTSEPFTTHSLAIDRTDESAALDDGRWGLMNQLAKTAADSPLLLANGSAPYGGGTAPAGGMMHGQVQCTRDLTAAQCTSCLTRYIDSDRLWDWGQYRNNAVGLTIKGYSCFLRFNIGESGAFELTLPPLPPRVAAVPPPPPPPSPSVSTGLKIGLSAAGSATLFIVLGLAVGLLLRRRRRRSVRLQTTAAAAERKLEEGSDFFNGEPEMEDEFEKSMGPKRFSYGELAIATDNFSDEHKLGEGGFGSVYRGFLKEMNNLAVAIKRVSKGSKQGRKEYAAEVRIISRLRHRNLVQLIGWCHGGGELLLIYELMPNGSLDAHLHHSSHNDGAPPLLPWPVRHEIVLGAASAILYLHQEWEQCVVHRDIKPSNVMLDASFNAKLGDFGLARLVDHGRGSHTTDLAGTTGYMDPECTSTGSFSTTSDVYSFGVLLLEVATGRRPVVVLQDGTAVHLAQRVWELYERGMVLHAADPRLNGAFDAREMECMLVVGLWCAHHDRGLRPSIRQAVSVLRFEASLPSLPERTPSVSLLSSVPSFIGSELKFIKFDFDQTHNAQ